MAHDCVLSRSESAGILRTARVVASAPLVAAAVEEGDLPVSKAEVLASVVSSRLVEAFVRDQQMLLDAVRLLSVDETRKLARFWQMRADVDGVEPERPARRLRFGVQDDGTTHFGGILGPEDGAVFKRAIEGIADQLWRERRTNPEHQNPPVDMKEKLRADALMEIIRRFGAADQNRPGARPLLNVTIDLPSLAGEADNPGLIEGGGVISAEDARRLACDASLSRVLLGPDGVILEMGREVRTATPGQQSFVWVRDKGCTWPGCDRPPWWCQIHHIIFWLDGGFTDVGQMTLLCHFHHHKIHDGGWHLERLDDGGLRFTGPDGQTLIRPPPSPPIPLPPPPRPKPNYPEDAVIRARLDALTAAA